MRSFLTFCLIIFCTLSLLAQTAEAKRFGGGRSFGVSRAISSPVRSAPTSSLTQRNNTNRWLGPLAGFAAGSLLTSLFMGHGIGSGILSWILIAGGVMLVISFLRNRNQTATSPQAPLGRNLNEYYQSATNFNHENFDTDKFLREAKAQFLRLQSAYDQKNLADIRNFTAPEVYAEIQLQLQELGHAENITEVKSLDARLLDHNQELEAEIASVQFSGMIDENRQGAVSFNEVWHFQKSKYDAAWRVAGIQQQ